MSRHINANTVKQGERAYRRGLITPEQEARLVGELREGSASRTVLAARFGLDMKRVIAIAKKHGIETKPRCWL